MDAQHPNARDVFTLLEQVIKDGDTQKAWEGFNGFISGVIADTQRADARKIREAAEKVTGRPSFRQGMQHSAAVIEQSKP